MTTPDRNSMLVEVWNSTQSGQPVIDGAEMMTF